MLDRRKMLLATAGATLFPNAVRAQRTPEPFLFDDDWVGGLDRTWRSSVAKDLEHGENYVRLKDGRRTWLVTENPIRDQGAVSMKIDWQKLGAIADEIAHLQNVHVHPPRTLAEFKKEQLEPVSGELEEGEFVADPPSLTDVVVNSESILNVPERLRGKIRYTGVVMTIGGGWSWRTDGSGKKMTNAEFNALGTRWKRVFVDFCKLSAKNGYRGDVTKMLGQKLAAKRTTSSSEHINNLDMTQSFIHEKNCVFSDHSYSTPFVFPPTSLQSILILQDAH